MPCYCDIPDSSDQKEIQRRCKERMYFDCQCLLTKEQIAECNEKSIGMFPIGDVNEKLCKICHVLTEEQMKKVSAYYFEIEWSYETLWDWYVQHCKDDKNFNE